MNNPTLEQHGAPLQRRGSSEGRSRNWKVLLPISLCGNIYIGYLFSGIPTDVFEGSSGDNFAIGDLTSSDHAFVGRDLASAEYNEWTGDASDVQVPAWAPYVDLDALTEDPGSGGSSIWSFRPDRLLTSSSSSSASSTSSSSSGSTATASSGGSSGGHHGPHQHDALLFLFNMLLVGTGVLHLSSLYPALQLSIALFVIGVLCSLLMEGLKVKESMGILGVSYGMWMEIDPHLLLFTMLPTLLAGDAMTIDTSVAKRVYKQCGYLATVGVCINAGLCAIFLQYWFNWSFLLSLVTGSILCATDPVAVVALLKELGASPKLTVLIQGESLLNDGTAIVLYTVAYNMLSGQKYDATDIWMFLIRVAVMGLALGVLLGFVFFTWIRIASNRFNHSAPIIQILLTLCAAYWSFVLAEGVLAMSGVLATVGCSLVLANYMWPYVVEYHAMLDFWHALEHLGNIIIFFLGGALTGAAMVVIDGADYINLVVIYAVLLILRGGLIFASRPLLRLLAADKEPVTTADALVMTWGGLRGAVGLALAIQVDRGKADGQIDTQTASRVLFFVGGIAFLTTCINAATCPMLVDWLGITNLPEAEARLLQKFNQQLVAFSQEQGHPTEVTDHLANMLAGIALEIASLRTHVQRNRVSIIKGKRESEETAIDIIAEYRECVAVWTETSQDARDKLEHWPPDGGTEVESMLLLLSKRGCDIEICRVVNETFLTMVDTQYWKQIKHGNLKPGSQEADILFSSVRYSQGKADLVDFKFLRRAEEGVASAEGFRTSVAARDAAVNISLLARTKSVVDAEKPDTFIGEIVDGFTFNVLCAIAIIFNVAFICIEEVVRTEDDQGSGWLIIEAIFTVFFICEFLLKFAHLKFAYFCDTWNLFDFVLVLFGIAGLIMSSLASGEAVGSESRILRMSRVLRTMRFLRLFRLFKFFRETFSKTFGKDKTISEDLAVAVQQIQTWNGFIDAHLTTQANLLKYFAGKVDESNEIELCRCTVQSMISVHKAVQIVSKLIQSVDQDLVAELHNLMETKEIIEQLEDFVQSAEKDGAISSLNAGALLHPLQHELSHCIDHVNEFRQGRASIHHHAATTSRKSKTGRITLYEALESERNTDKTGGPASDSSENAKRVEEGTAARKASPRPAAAKFADDATSYGKPEDLVSVEEPDGEPAFEEGAPSRSPDPQKKSWKKKPKAKAGSKPSTIMGRGVMGAPDESRTPADDED